MKRKLTPQVATYLECGKFIAYVWPGGYPVIYVDRGGDVMCADCARTTLRDYPETWPVIAGVHWEGPPEYCSDCGITIASAYGNPDDNGETE